jgi:hypothetical protein
MLTKVIWLLDLYQCAKENWMNEQIESFQIFRLGHIILINRITYG